MRLTVNVKDQRLELVSVRVVFIYIDALQNLDPPNKQQ